VGVPFSGTSIAMPSSPFEARVHPGACASSDWHFGRFVNKTPLEHKRGCLSVSGASSL
jgi:hypothetical protein